MKIATHDSMTGEPSLWLSYLFVPFAKTQSKTIKQQYEAGCRLFDIRCKKVLGNWRGAHGWWFSRTSIVSVLAFLNTKKDTHVSLTFEGRADKAKEFIEFAKMVKYYYTNIKFGKVCAKYSDKSLKVKYKTLIDEDKNWIDAKIKKGFFPLDGTNWQTYIPIPWLWKKKYYDKPQFSDAYYLYVDFL